MKPYYEHAGITIYHGDCLDIAAAMNTESVDCIITDPPYGQKWESGRRQASFGPIVNDDGSYDIRAAIKSLAAVLRGLRHAYFFGRWPLGECGFGGFVELVWSKELTSPPTGSLAPWGTSHEFISFGVKANTAQRHGGTGNVPARLRKGSVLTYQRLSGAAVSRHPTEKPVALLRELIESSSHISEVVFDPFCGSGSTLEAALLEGRKAIGVEIEERYCEIAAKRLSQGALDLEMPA